MLIAGLQIKDVIQVMQRVIAHFFGMSLISSLILVLERNGCLVCTNVGSLVLMI